jgi:hypothetical protein
MSCYTTPGYLSKGMQDNIQQRCHHTHVFNSTIHNNHTMEISVVVHQQVNKENVAYTHNDIFFSHKGQYYVIFRKTDEIRDNHVKQVSQTQINITCFLSYEESRFKKKN